MIVHILSMDSLLSIRRTYTHLSVLEQVLSCDCTLNKLDRLWSLELASLGYLGRTLVGLFFIGTSLQLRFEMG